MYRWVDHTSEVELAISATSEEEVYADAMRGLAELLDPGEDPGEASSVEVDASAPDRPALLAAWLEELVYLAESRGFVPRSLERLETGPTEIEATVSGSVGKVSALVKAVTYHRLRFEEGPSGWEATVVLDV